MYVAPREIRREVDLVAREHPVQGGAQRVHSADDGLAISLDIKNLVFRERERFQAHWPVRSQLVRVRIVPPYYPTY
jgi:hypothetical protein